MCQDKITALISNVQVEKQLSKDWKNEVNFQQNPFHCIEEVKLSCYTTEHPTSNAPQTLCSVELFSFV